jgi:Predicted integral membrane protein
MKRLLLASSIALMMLSSTAAFAAPRDGGHDRGGSSHHDRDHDRRGDRDYRRDRDRNSRWAQNRGHDNGRHLGHYKFRRGDRVPVVYLQQRYYVPDYRVYHLAPPPRGYRWVRPDDGRFLLIATTTGLISEILGY